MKGLSPEGRTPSFPVLGAQARKTSQPTGSVALPQPLVARTKKMEPDKPRDSGSEQETRRERAREGEEVERQQAREGWDREREITKAERQQAREEWDRETDRHVALPLAHLCVYLVVGSAFAAPHIPLQPHR